MTIVLRIRPQLNVHETGRAHDVIAPKLATVGERRSRARADDPCEVVRIGADPASR